MIPSPLERKKRRYGSILAENLRFGVANAQNGYSMAASERHWQRNTLGRSDGKRQRNLGGCAQNATRSDTTIPIYWRVDMNSQVKLIDQSKIEEHLYSEIILYKEMGPEWYERRVELEALYTKVKQGDFAPDTPPVPTIKPGDSARHPDLGEVVVQWVGDNTAEVAVGIAHYEVSPKDLEVIGDE